MGWHRMPFGVPVEVSEGVKLAMVLYGTAILLVMFAVLCRLADGRRYRRHGPRGGLGPGPSRTGTRTARGCSQPASGSCGMIWWPATAPARPLTREGAEMPHDRDQGRRLTAFILAAACVVRGGALTGWAEKRVRSGRQVPATG